VNCDRVSQFGAKLRCQVKIIPVPIFDWAGRWGGWWTHELVQHAHKIGEHAAQGMEKPALSGRQLIAADLRLSAFDIARLKQKLSYR